MARGAGGPSFEQRVAAAGLSPQQRENAGATLLLAEMFAEVIDLMREQNELLAEIRDGRPVSVVHNHTTGAPSGTDDGKGGGGDVRLREPAVPPPDPDDTTTDPAADGGGTVAGTSTGKAPTRRQATKAAAGKTPAAKTTAAARRGASGGKL